MKPVKKVVGPAPKSSDIPKTFAQLWAARVEGEAIDKMLDTLRSTTEAILIFVEDPTKRRALLEQSFREFTQAALAQPGKVFAEAAKVAAQEASRSRLIELRKRIKAETDPFKLRKLIDEHNLLNAGGAGL